MTMPTASTPEEPGLLVPVLVIEDDLAICRLLAAAMLSTEFRVLEAHTAKSALELIAHNKPEAILLDLGLPDQDGVEFIKTVREWCATPIIVVSGQGDEERKILALEAGADDYVTKPFGVGELLARLRTAWRRTQAVPTSPGQPVVEIGSVAVDMIARIVRKNGENVHLTPIEYKLLLYLIKNAGRVVTHRQILAEVWGDAYAAEDHYIRLYIGYLRKKLEDDPTNPTLILNEPRVGYRLVGQG